jgi:ribosomal protein S18 acetylase RimI-like enzyme
VRIRDLKPEDYDELVALWEASGLPYRPLGRDRRDRMAREMEGDSAVFLAAEEDGALIGVVLGTHDGRKGWINRLAVHPEHRSRGIGTALVAAVEAKLHERGIEIVTCLIERWNEGSAAFFERIGYVPHPDIAYYSKRRSPDT